MPFRRTLVVALLSALPMLSAAAADATAPAPETIKWVLPWKDGVSLTYAEDHATTDETKPQRERSRSTSNTVIRITESSADGFVQTWTGSGYLAGGHFLFGTQYPSGAIWTSDDGLRWSRAPDVPALSQGKIQGVAAGGPGLVAVGSFGSPDFSIPTVWISPPS